MKLLAAAQPTAARYRAGFERSAPADSPPDERRMGVAQAANYQRGPPNPTAGLQPTPVSVPWVSQAQSHRLACFRLRIRRWTRFRPQSLSHRTRPHWRNRSTSPLTPPCNTASQSPCFCHHCSSSTSRPARQLCSIHIRRTGMTMHTSIRNHSQRPTPSPAGSSSRQSAKGGRRSE